MSEKFPKDWKIKPLGSFIKNIGDGGTPSTSDQSNFGGGIPWIVISDIQREIWKTKTTLSEKGLKKSSSKLWKPQTVILSTGATIGQVGIAKTKLATKQGITGIECDDNLLPEYLYYFLKNNKHLLLSLSQGSTIEEIRAPTLVKLNVSIPPLPEQKKIVSILTSVDNVIEKIQAQINKLQDLKKAIMNELLTRGIGHTDFKDSELGKIPKIWKLYTIGQLGEVVGGGTPTSDNLKYWDGTVMWATPTDINKLKGRYIKETVKTLTEEGLRNSSAKLHPIGTILLTSRASIGFPAITLLPMATNQGFQSLRPNENLDTEYGYQVLLHNKHNLKRLSAGSTFLEISSKEIKQFKLPIPPLSEQKKIASILISINNLIEKKERQLDKIQSLKKSLLQDLLTGKIRVAVN